MTVLLNQDRLRLIAVAMPQRFLQPPRPTPTLHWAVDDKTGRPVGNWVLKDAPDAAQA